MTFAVIARDEKDGLLGIAISTSALAVGARCPFVRANVGAVSTQAYTDPGIGPLALELLQLGLSPAKALIDLGESDPDHSYRQVGIVDRHGRAAAHTGTDAMTCKGHITAEIRRDRQPPEIRAGRAGYEPGVPDSTGELLEDRLLKTIVAGRDAGGDRDGHRTASMLVDDTDPYPRTDLRIDFMPKTTTGPDAVDALALLLDKVPAADILLQAAVARSAYGGMARLAARTRHAVQRLVAPRGIG